jgi:hypothetical protein
VARHEGWGSTWAALAVAGVIAVAAACSGPMLQQDVQVALPDVIAGELGARDAVPWSRDRRLMWSDFRAKPPVDPQPEAALTTYGLFYGVRCTGLRFEFQVTAAFLPNESWVQPQVLDSPADRVRSLAHEQTHFDLTEVHARRMRRYFGEMYQPCLRSQIELDRLANRFIEDELDAQQLYDLETGHGRVIEQQARWDQDVAVRLDELDRFASR